MRKGKMKSRCIWLITWLAIIWLSLPNNLLAQTTEVIKIDSLPKDGILLDKGWKYYSGDNPDYANADYDDRDWQPIDPTMNVEDLPPVIRTGIGWIRLHVSKGVDIRGVPLALLINQYVASEIYVNGQLAYSFGNISFDPDQIVAYNPAAKSPIRGKPYAMPSIDESDIVLAIRFAVPPNIHYVIGANSSPLVLLRLTTVNAAFDQVWKNERYIPINNIFRVGAYIILAVLHLAFFIYNPNKKAYLFFFLFAIFYIPADILQFNLPYEVKGIQIVTMVYYALWQISGLFLMTALYLLLNQKMGWIYWTLVIATLIGFFWFNWVFSTLIVQNLVGLELVRTCLKALKLKTRGSWILATGALSYLIFNGAFVVGVQFGLDYWYFPLSDIHILADLLYVISALSIPVATTIYIALDFAFTSHVLQDKLIEVQKLSELTIEQEKEKQVILSSVNETLEKQVTERTYELRESLENLKATQSQLIQSEKMASLGELTAGIAHEIQNPLNFVNNFAEINKELIRDLKSEIKNGKLDEVNALADDIEANEEKINFHGKRADAIVKSMLQHSRSSSGKRELTDINALCDEYLRLAYHGYRAKDKSFNAKFEIHLDPSLPKVNVVAQDIGRVVLNLINNAFYVVNEKAKQSIDGYEPTVTVSTSFLSPSGGKGEVKISIKDNGNGIPDSIKEKIFQPFFTTKPTGQGTGLGLSMSYDIVKAHGGEIKVESNQRSGTSFIISLNLYI
jgi:signal transduction histidine kinase